MVCRSWRGTREVQRGDGDQVILFINLLYCLYSFIHGDGSNQRNFLYVTDVANAFDTITHKGGVGIHPFHFLPIHSPFSYLPFPSPPPLTTTIGNVYNIGTDFEISNLDVAKKLIQMFGLDEEKHMVFVENRPFNDCRYKINSDKLAALGWKPLVSWEEGLKRTSMSRGKKARGRRKEREQGKERDDTGKQFSLCYYGG